MTNLLGFLTLAENSEASRQKIKICTFDAKLRFAIMVLTSKSLRKAWMVLVKFDYVHIQIVGALIDIQCFCLILSRGLQVWLGTEWEERCVLIFSDW